MKRLNIFYIIIFSLLIAVINISDNNEKGVKMKKLDNFKWTPRWVTYMGCMESCMKYHNIDINSEWLYGISGMAFALNISPDLCPSGPTAWKTEPIAKLCLNAGIDMDYVLGFKNNADFKDKQKEAYEKVKKAIDENNPCFGWELEIPEFYIIHGYDDIGYYYSGVMCEKGKGPKPWQELGDTGIGSVEAYIIKKGTPKEIKKAIKEALEIAIEISQSPTKWIFPNYKGGLKGYDIWIDALQTDKKKTGFGAAYNTAVWSECRNYAVSFLKLAKEKLYSTSI